MGQRQMENYAGLTLVDSHWLSHRIIHYLDGLKTNFDSLVHLALQWLEIKVHTKQ